MDLVHMVFEAAEGWYTRVFVALCFWMIPCSIPLLIMYLLISYSWKKIGVVITSTRDLEKLTKSNPVKTETYVSKRSGLKMTYKYHGDGSKIFFLAAGLGCREYLWYPMLKQLADEGNNQEWTFVTWWYRGMFGADSKEDMSMSVADAAEDVKELLEEFRAKRGEDTIIDVFLGWSAGVQVVLQFAQLYPDCVGKLIINCGTHGNIAETFLQPFCRILPLSLFLKYALRTTRNVIWKFADEIINFAEKYVIPFGGVTIFGIGSLPMWISRGRPVGRWLFQAYVEEYLCNGPEHLRNYLSFTVELDKHSAYDKLHEIKHNTLILTGFLDFITPSYLSYEIHNILPNSEIRCWNLGTHFIHIEYQEQVCKEIQNFLKCGKSKTSTPAM